MDAKKKKFGCKRAVLSRIFFLAFLIGILALTLTLASCAYSGKIESYVQDTGAVQVYFCPQENCERALVEFMDSAQESLHCAFFEIGLDSVKQKLLEKSKTIDVKVVTDDQYLKKFNYSLAKPDSYGLMHNKFCIIDGKKISSGSMNPTDNDAYKNNNNLLLIESEVLARNYEAEFGEMWNGTFKKGGNVLNPRVRVGNITLENYFCPEDHCANQVKEALKQARSSIDFMTFSFTHQGIANILLLKQLENLSIRGVMETKQISKYSKYPQLLYNGVAIRKDGNKYNLHHKVFIIDNQIVVTGSFNPTAGGDQSNDENVLIIRDEEIAHRFEQEFEKVWKEAEGEK